MGNNFGHCKIALQLYNRWWQNLNLQDYNIRTPNFADNIQKHGLILNREK